MSRPTHTLPNLPCLMITLGMAVVWTHSAHADEDPVIAECSQLVSSLPNSVDSALPAVRIDEDRNNSEDLAYIAGFHNDRNHRLGGITNAIPKFDYEVDPNLAFLPDNRGVCARPALHLTLGYNNFSIFMNIDLPRNTCLYNAVLSHEMHHVDIYRNYLNKNLPRFKQLVDDKFNGRAYRFNTIYEAKQYTEILGQVFMQKLQHLFSSEVNAEQADLDTQAEYARVQLSCNPAQILF